MAVAQQPPLNWENSVQSEPQVLTTLPADVTTCLKNCRYLSLATCSPQAVPHVCLMSFTYLPSTPFSPHPTVIMTSNPSSQKTLNIVANPNVCLSVHDWMPHRPATEVRDPERTGVPPLRATSALAQSLLSINTAALSRIGVTIDGEARVLATGSEEETWCKQQHLENHTFTENDGAEVNGVSSHQEAILGSSPDARMSNPIISSGGSKPGFLEGEDVSVVVVQVKKGRIADVVDGGVRDWVLSN